MKQIILSLCILMASGSYVLAESVTADQLESFRKLPPSESCRLIDFDEVQIGPGFIPDTWFAIVTGTKPWASMTVELRPMIYIVRPEYWAIEVVACQTGFGLPQVAPYLVTLPLEHFLGTKGIEIVGATKKKRVDVPPK